MDIYNNIVKLYKELRPNATGEQIIKSSQFRKVFYYYLNLFLQICENKKDELITDDSMLKIIRESPNITREDIMDKLYSFIPCEKDVNHTYLDVLRYPKRNTIIVEKIPIYYEIIEFVEIEVIGTDTFEETVADIIASYSTKLTREKVLGTAKHKKICEYYNRVGREKLFTDNIYELHLKRCEIPKILKEPIIEPIIKEEINEVAIIKEPIISNEVAIIKEPIIPKNNIEIIKKLETREEALQIKHIIEDSKNGINDDIKNLIVKDIEGTNGKFAIAIYCDYEVIMLRENGFINATKLCEIENTLFYRWLENDKSKELMVGLSEEVNQKKSIQNKNKYLIEFKGNIVDVSNVIIELRENTHGNLQGTYIHPDLIMAIAVWGSDIFYLKVNRIMKNYLIQKAITESNLKLREKDSEISELKEMMLEFQRGGNILMSEVREVNNKNDILITEVREVSNKNDKLLSEVIETKKETQLIKKQLKKALEYYTKDPDNEQVILYKLKENTYRVISNKEKYLKSRLINEYKKYPNIKELYKIEKLANAKSLLGNFRKHLNIKKNNDFYYKSKSLLSNADDELKELLNELYIDNFAIRISSNDI